MSKIEILEKENGKLREQLAEEKVEARVPGLETLDKAIDRATKGDVLGGVCTTCAKKLMEIGYRVCLVDTISRETQTESWEADTQKPVEDAAITQELADEMVQSKESNLVADT